MKKRFVVVLIIVVVLIVYFMSKGHDAPKELKDSFIAQNFQLVPITKDVVAGTWTDGKSGTIEFALGDVSKDSPGYNAIYKGTFHAKDVGPGKRNFDGWWNIDEQKGTILLEAERTIPVAALYASIDMNENALKSPDGKYSFTKVK